MGVELPLRVVVTILECCVTFSGVKLSIRPFVLFIIIIIVEVKTGIVSIESLTHGGNAAGLVKTLKQSLSKIGVQELDASDDNPILIGLGSDGGSVNKDGVTKALKELAFPLVGLYVVCGTSARIGT